MLLIAAALFAVSLYLLLRRLQSAPQVPST
jgi:hypothetical protein